jgi:NCS1 family nucleobase:cation symporter-1
MNFFPHTPSQLDHPNTGEEIIAAEDEKKLLSGERKVQRSLMSYIPRGAARAVFDSTAFPRQGG